MVKHRQTRTDAHNPVTLKPILTVTDLIGLTIGVVNKGRRGGCLRSSQPSGLERYQLKAIRSG